MVEYMTRSEYQAKSLDKHSLLATLTFSDNHTQSLKICPLCARFQIRAVPEVPEEGCLLFSVISRRKIHHEYEDIYPAFPNMEKRATNGCTFCTFIRTSLLSEYCKLNRCLGRKEEAVQVILTASLDEGVEDESALSMYRSQEPHTIEARVRRRDDNWNAGLLTYEIAFQMLQDPLSVANVSNFTEWLQECDAKHSPCSAALTGYTPTRLLAVEDGTLRIVAGRRPNITDTWLSATAGDEYPRIKSSS
ncbi:hypothetical protein K469DRAFT_690836 [Zopfia rhizophila CBS 207.26]|uniref:Heterokaryon incompatibility domain-containing protein n=1 Tax=Zopfia rhizophila CBS 207.26 TaxID=1314779 RepID=A0A6A6DUB7_9PEZI|nr:hypothetical protein K469DRAFT_690836 [Zopfia rhizophila CBS 207.26]